MLPTLVFLEFSRPFVFQDAHYVHVNQRTLQSIERLWRATSIAAGPGHKSLMNGLLQADSAARGKALEPAQFRFRQADG